jgi:AraC family transcriptional regulator, regulatory protein of adaptative response / methylated-DNA-[protein]-cysteine methyltransferase
MQSSALAQQSAIHMPSHSVLDSGNHASTPVSNLALAWKQVVERDPRADGCFVYAVRSTGIYCRPTCPSRRPARTSVDFFLSAAEAEHAGFRACKRCRPHLSVTQADPHAAAVAEAARRFSENCGETIRLSDLAREFGMSRLALLRAFRRVFGVTPAEFARAQRMDRLRNSLHAATPATRITDAIYDAGFGSSSRVYETTSAGLGMTPRTLRAGAPETAITYTTAASALGRILVAATAQGVCAIAFGRNQAELLADLRARFPRARLAQAKSAEGWLADAVAYIASQTTEHPLAATFPLDLRATAFQHRVWKALQQIPRGETCSYAAVARKLGRPTAARAVARAIATNPVAVVVPCHRVIGSDGSLTGYRWGVDRKQRLLAAEKLK